jgi:NADPH:quinone reductase-like Zn-dependent oxidoreductase
MRAVRFSHNPLFLSVLLAHFLFYSEYNNNFYFRLGSGRKEKYGMENYKDKTAVITGGTSGLGLAIAKNIGKKGAHIFITDAGRKKENRLNRSFVMPELTRPISVRIFPWKRIGTK